MSNTNRPTGTRPIIERLESRQLLAGDASVVRPLPFVLEFATDHASTSLHDKDGQGTGFTYVQPNRLGNEYDPSLIDLRTNEGVLRLTTAGNVANQGNYGKDNTQINALQTQFDASGDRAFTITTRPVEPSSVPIVDIGMTRTLASTEARDPRGGYVVRKPRASDAVGGSLRNIYAADQRLPTDLAALIDRLNGTAH